ncbi:MAG: hypothetical protein K1X95_05520 [Acidimicrobiia bacterium]|nr:hypothetical protein [Acidimicrobiia bacterium]
MKLLGRIAALAAALMIGFGMFAVAAEAQSYPHPPTEKVGPHGDPGDPGDPGLGGGSGNASVADPGAASTSLPFTGGDVLGLLAIGAVLAGTGFAVVYTSRRRRHAVS